MMLVLVLFVAAAIFIIVIVVMFMIMFTMMMVMFMIVVMLAATFSIVVVMMLVIMIMVTAALLSIMMMVIVAVAFHMLVDLIEQSAVVHRMIHPVLELVLIHVEHCTHECEIDPLLGIQIPVLLDAVRHVGEIVSDSSAVIEGHSGLDVSEHRAGFLLDPFSDLHHSVFEPCFRVCVPAADSSGDACSAPSGLFKRCLLSAHFIIP
jgi:small-conductance mechanosensitive channel